MEDSYIIVALICTFVLAFNFREVKQASLLEVKNDRLYIYMSQIFLFVGVLIRLIYLDYPYGINNDEAMANYNAWCIANYGVDMHLDSYPVYLKAWGSGQNALYTYLSVPFVKLFGLSLPILRLPMAILGSISVICLYYTSKKIGMTKFFVFLITLFIAFNPWHFTKSRWSLESNFAPDFVLIGTCLIVLAYYCKSAKKQSIYYILGFISLGLSAYGYAVAWLMLPFYCLFIFAYVLKKKKISVKTCVIAIIAIFVITFPLLLFVFQLQTKGDAITIGHITIPKLNGSRFDSTSLIGSSTEVLLDYLYYALKGLIMGYDSFLANSFGYTGQFYNPLGWIFIIIAFVFYIRQKEKAPLDSFLSLGYSLVYLLLY